MDDPDCVARLYDRRFEKWGSNRGLLMGCHTRWRSSFVPIDFGGLNNLIQGVGTVIEHCKD